MKFRILTVLFFCCLSCRARDEKINFLVSQFDLNEIQDGIYLKEIYRAEGTISKNGRNYATSIYYLLTDAAKDRFHKIKSDEIWNFYEGSDVHLTVISSKGVLEQIIINEGNRQFTVKEGSWYYASTEGAYAFMGLVVAPGFIPSDYEIAEEQFLLETYPQHKETIKQSYNR